jgi:phosphoribosylformylglycinamidine synthase
MYVDGNLEGPFGEKRKVSGMPVLLFTVSSVIGDINTCISMDAKFPGDLVYVLGETKDELGGSEYYQMMGKVGCNVPKVDAKKMPPPYIALSKAIQQGLVSSAHAVTRGGLGVHLAMTAMAGELGMEIHLEDVPTSEGLSDTRILYSESAGRFVLTVDPKKKDLFEKIFDGMKIGLIGSVIQSPLFRVKSSRGATLIEEDVMQLKACWKKPFGGLV